MAKDVLVAVVPCLMEVIHVQLSDEGGEVVMFEVLRENSFCKFVGLPNYKAIPCVVPTDNLVT